MDFRKTIMICTLFLISSFIFGQDTKDRKNSYKNGVLTKVIEYPMPMINISPKTRNIPKIQKMIINGEENYYYKIKSNNTNTASENLPDLITAISRLKKESKIDLASNPDFLLNKYMTEDEFEIAYEISDNSLKWYVDSKYEISIEVVTAIQSSLELALTKIDSLRNN